MTPEILRLLEGIASQPASEPKGVITREQARDGAAEIRELMTKAENRRVEEELFEPRERDDSKFTARTFAKITQLHADEERIREETGMQTRAGMAELATPGGPR